MARRPTLVPVPRSRAIAGLLSISFVVPFAFVLILSAFDVPLGQGYFRYRWSPVRDLRARGALMVVPVLAVAGTAVWLLAKRGADARRGGVALFIVATISMGLWAWLAPPQAMTQQMFNLTSPSSDGAFLLEAGQVRSLPQYLRDFPQHVGRETPQLMGGTRILSNPPGMTAFTYIVLSATPRETTWLDRLILDRDASTPDQLPLATLRLGAALILVWIASMLAAYGLGRVFLSPAGAAVFAIIATFNPCTVNFVPGKDPAQLLTINLMLWAWFAGWKQRYLSLCALAGALLVIGSTFGLIHIWVALAALSATLWHDRARWREVCARYMPPAVVGAILIVAVAWLAIGWNIPLTLWATARRWTDIQRSFDMNRPLWYLIGLPIVLLFVSPGLWTLAGLALRCPRLSFGTRLAICTVAIMLLIYFAMGVTYELPRLWVAFLPPLTLGLAIDWPLLRGRIGEHPRVAKVLVLIVLVQIFFTAFHWTFLDAREAEYRLITKRFYH